MPEHAPNSFNENRRETTMHKALLTAASIAALSVASSAGAQEKLKFAVFTPEAEMTYQVVMKPWAERVNKDSGGTLDIQTFPNGALGRNPALQSKMLQDGVADIAWVIPSYTPGVYLDDDVFELPNIIQNSIEGSLASWHLLQAGKLRGYDQYYMIGLFTTSPYTFHTNFPVRKAEDLRGKKIRAVGTVSTEAVKALGAVPEGMPFPQLPEAISRGVIDGTTGHPIAVYDFGVSRVTNSHFLGKIGTVTLGIFMNKARFEKLPAPARAAIEKHRGEALSRAFGKMSEDRNDELIAEWQKDPKRIVTVRTPDQTAEWDKILEPVVAGWEAKDARNKALLSTMRQDLATTRASR
jgi:TRAP-type C4-dicarboxylate transport system substrate-binding protein